MLRKQLLIGTPTCNPHVIYTGRGAKHSPPVQAIGNKLIGHWLRKNQNLNDFLHSILQSGKSPIKNSQSGKSPRTFKYWKMKNQKLYHLSTHTSGPVRLFRFESGDKPFRIRFVTKNATLKCHGILKRYNIS